MKKVLCAMGTRPEVIKMAPVVKALKTCPEIDLRVLCTAQHREMLDGMMKLFQIHSDIDLNIMEYKQTLPQLTSKLPVPLDEALYKEKPDLVLTQGDTTTAFMVSLASFYQHIPVGHVEAGLRSNVFNSPFPEEMNRVMIGRLARLHFAPTELARQNLLKEGVLETGIHVTGNTVIDSLDYIIKQKLPLDSRIDPSKRLILVTAHRRENHGEKLVTICRALRDLVDANGDVQILYPVHPNPLVKDTVYEYLADHDRIILTEPMGYEYFISTMKHAYLVISDSGGVQEEAPSLQTPALIMRENTERPEAANLGASKLVGVSYNSIISSAQELLDNPEAYKKMIIHHSPYGDSHAGERISKIIQHHLNGS